MSYLGINQIDLGSKFFFLTNLTTTLCDLMDCSLTRFLHPWDFPGKNTGVGCLSFSRRFSQPRDWIQVSRIVGRAYNLSHQGRSLDNYKQVIWVLWQWSFICVCSIKEKSKLLSPCLGTKLLQFNLLKRPSFPNTLEWHHGHKSGNQTSRSISGSLISRIYFLYPCANTTILVTVVLISLISSKFIKF